MVGALESGAVESVAAQTDCDPVPAHTPRLDSDPTLACSLRNP